MANKRKRSKKNTSDRSGHFKSLNDVAHPLADEANKTVKIIIYVLLVLATFAIYSQVQDHEFINYDDDAYITNNLNVQAGFTRESVEWAFTKSYYSDWQPITWLSYILDYQLYGLNPKGYHLTSLFFHIANSLILFMVLLRMTGALWQCSFVAALFAFHPLNVESVAWAAERKNVLSTLFWLLTMWAYIRYAEKPNIKRYGSMILFFILGLMSKPMLITLPFVLLLMDYWPLRRFKLGQEKGNGDIPEKYTDKGSDILRLVREKIPLFLLAAGSGIVAFMVNKVVLTMKDFSLSERLTNAMVSYLEYLEKTAWPKGLAIFYPHPGNSLVVWKGVLCGAALLGITVIAIRFIKKAPYFVVGWFWYLGTLVPVIGIVQAGGQAMADRYAYVPLIGIFIIVAWGLPELMAKWRHRNKVLIVLAGIWIPTLMVMTWTQVGHWENSITIFKHTIRVTNKTYPTFALAHYNLGNALVAEGKNEEAISHYKMAIKINPSHANAHYNLGIALFAKEKNEEAISHYKVAIKLKPDYAEAYSNLGMALVAEGKIEEAISHYKMAIKLKPDSAEPYNNLGNALVTEGKNEEAVSQYKMAIKIKPDYAKAYNNLGIALFAKRKIEEAISHYKMAIKLNPNYTNAHYNLGSALQKEGKNSEAISHYKMAIKINPDFAGAYNNLGAVLFNANMTEEAIDYFKEAIRIRPGFTAAQKNLETALLRSEELE
ncbi:tetratricopeptide repeat protein [Nitrospinaceae bacterium]|nr:tetratricopeptide repeat protein [Nitrospinaceae bacterium]